MAWLLELPLPPVGMTRRSVSSSHQAAYPVVCGEKIRENTEKSRLFRPDGIVCFLLPLRRVGRGYARCMDEHEERGRAAPPWPETPEADALMSEALELLIAAGRRRRIREGRDPETGERLGGADEGGGREGAA
jgi:hypothetical protein